MREYRSTEQSVDRNFYGHEPTNVEFTASFNSGPKPKNKNDDGIYKKNIRSLASRGTPFYSTNPQFWVEPQTRAR